MKWFLNLKTAQKLALGFGLCLVLSLAIGATAIARMGQMNAGTRTIVDDALQGNSILTRLAPDIKQFRLFEFNHVLSTDPAAMSEVENKIKDKRADVEKGIQDYAASAAQPEDKANAEELGVRWKAYLADHDKVVAVSHTNNFKGANGLMKARKPRFDALDEQISKIAAWNKKRGETLAAEAGQTYAGARNTVIALLIVAITLSTLIAAFMGRLFAGTIREVAGRMEMLRGLCLANLCAAMEAMAQGDLTAKIVTGTPPLAVNSRDELGDIARSFNGTLDATKATVASFERAQAALSELLAHARTSADSIATSSEEVAAGNQDLSQRTEEQASSLEETASSMEQMTSTVKQNADNARHADQLAAQSREVAEQGGQVVREAVAAMAEINNGSKKIADIVSVIDEIAFQTNLLALNAAVEAARVGEQGRGFAVVAAEVRSLAGRSATAAKEIKTLVQNSVAQVEQGSHLVNNSGAQLDEIVGSVKKTADIIAEISAASIEQSAGIEQVNKAVMQMDQITQQNAALVEEASAASQSMAQQAKTLQSLVARFQIDTKYLLQIQQAPAAVSRPAAATLGNGTTGRASSRGGSLSVRRPASAPAASLTVVGGGAQSAGSSADEFEEF